MKFYIRFAARLQLLIYYGICWIRTKGKRPKKYPRVIIANHVGSMDHRIMYYLTGASFVAANLVKASNVCGIYEIIGLIYVDHESKASRKETVKAMELHIKDENKPPLFVFPEATLHNTRSLVKFSMGAFRTGHAVLPIYIDYTNFGHNLFL